MARPDEPLRKCRLSPQPRRALELLKLLTSSPHGATKTLLVVVHGFDTDMIAGHVRAGLAAEERDVMKAGGKTSGSFYAGGVKVGYADG